MEEVKTSMWEVPASMVGIAGNGWASLTCYQLIRHWLFLTQLCAAFSSPSERALRVVIAQSRQYFSGGAGHCAPGREVK